MIKPFVKVPYEAVKLLGIIVYMDASQRALSFLFEDID